MGRARARGRARSAGVGKGSITRSRKFRKFTILIFERRTALPSPAHDPRPTRSRRPTCGRTSLVAVSTDGARTVT